MGKNKKNMSPDRLARQIWKAVLKNWLWTVCMLVAVLALVFLSDSVSDNWLYKKRTKTG